MRKNSTFLRNKMVEWGKKEKSTVLEYCRLKKGMNQYYISSSSFSAVWVYSGKRNLMAS